MELVTAEQMARIDRRTSEVFGVPSLVLMEQAGYHVACLAADLVIRSGDRSRPVIVVAGKGNNGGDGLVAARYLHQWGFDARVILPGAPVALGADPMANLRCLQAIGVPVTGSEGIDVGQALAGAGLVIDALLGTGLKGAASGKVAEAIEMINVAGKPVLAVDVPSGLNADTGTAEGPCVRAGWTVTMCRPKLGNVLFPGAEYSGEVAVAPIPIPEEAITAEGVKTRLLSRDIVARMLPPRPRISHKGTFGHVLVIGGSTGFGGAPFLAAAAALRGGAGLVSLACPPAVAVSGPHAPEVMVHPLGGMPNHLASDIWPGIRQLIDRADVLCVGPGLGRHRDTADLLDILISGTDKPLVLDADGLNLLDSKKMAAYRGPLVVTPHPGETARLLGTERDAVQADRSEAAGRVVADMAGAGLRVCVLKGAGTVVADGEGNLLVNPIGTSALATAGTGDVLAGLIASLLAQGKEPLEAAGAGVYIHSMAGLRAARRRGERSVVVGDVILELGNALQEVEDAVEGVREDEANMRLFPLIWLTKVLTGGYVVRSARGSNAR